MKRILLPLLLLGCGLKPDAPDGPGAFAKLNVTSMSSSDSLTSGLCVLAGGEAQCLKTYSEDYLEEPGIPERSLSGATTLVEGGICAIFSDGRLGCDDKALVASDVKQAHRSGGLVCFVAVDASAKCVNVWGSANDWSVPLNGSRARQMAVSEDQVCALLEDSTVMCWERDYGTVVKSGPPLVIAGMTGATQIGITEEQNAGSRPGLIWGCALVAQGQVKCWNSDVNAEPLTITDLDNKGAPLTGITTIAVASTKGCGVKQGGTVHCWGNYVLNLGNDAADGAEKIPHVKDATAITLGPRIDCAVNSRGEVACWGGVRYVGPQFSFVPIPS